MKAWLAVGFAFVGLVVYLSLTHDPIQTPDVGFKIGHVLAYAWLMFWFSQIFRASRTRWTIGLMLVVMGVLLEYIQGMTGYRHFGYTDMRDNAIGVLLGLGVALTPLGHALPVLDRTLARL